jgi:hypothetical protein
VKAHPEAYREKMRQWRLAMRRLDQRKLAMAILLGLALGIAIASLLLIL